MSLTFQTMTNAREPEIKLFFKKYSDRFNESFRNAGNENITAAAFSDCFIAASPFGVICGKNDETFPEAIKKGYGFYRSIGIKSMEILSTQITLLDEYHAMVKVSWKSIFVKDQADGSIDFDVIYFLQDLENEIKIFAYITGDEQRALHEKGLI